MGGEVVNIPSPLKQEDVVKPPILVRLLPLGLGVLFLVFMIMMVGSGTRMFSPMMMFAPLMMMGSMFGFVGFGRTSGGSAEVDIERKNYALHLSEQRKLAHQLAEWVHKLTVTNYPNPDALLGLVGSKDGGMWQASPDPDDTGEVAPDEKLTTNPYLTARVGVGLTRLVPELQHEELEVVENLEPVTAGMFYRFREAQQVVSNAAIGVRFDTAPVYAMRGNQDKCLGLVRAMIHSVAYNHVPGDVQLGVISDRAESEWGWMKWLPHVQDTSRATSASTPRLAWESLGSFFAQQSLDITERINTNGERSSHMLVIVDMPNSEVSWPHNVPTSIPGVTFLLVRSGTDRISELENRWMVSDDGLFNIPDALAYAKADYMTREEAARVAQKMARYVPPGFGELSGTAVREAATSSAVPTMFDALGIDDIETYDPRETWRKNAYTESFETPIGTIWEHGKGVRASTIETLNIMETSRNGNGVHGAIQGKTGTGKSYLLKGVVTCMCATYGPDKLNFILMDFKGGSTFFGFENLPHITANISDLKEATELVGRTVEVLQGELARRKELFAKYKTGDILDYRKAQAKNPDMPVLPDLVVLIDEFREYMAQNREALTTIFSIGAQGRSLGIHCVPCSQFIDQSLIGEFHEHLSWGISLKVNSTQGANMLIGSTKPLELSEGTGEAMIRKSVDGREKTVYFAGFDVYAPYVRKQRTDTQRRASQLRVRSALRAFTLLNQPEDLLGHRAEPEVEETVVEETDERMLDVLLNKLSQYQDLRALRLWQEPINTPMSLANIDATPAPAKGLSIRIGDTDAPREHARLPYELDITDGNGHIRVIGRPKSGRSTAIQTMVVSSMIRYQTQIAWYLVEYSGSKLSEVEDCPNVGGYATRTNIEAINRFLGEFHTIMDIRLRMTGKHKVSLEEYLRRKRNGEFTDPADAADIASDTYEHMVLVLDGFQAMIVDDEAWKDTKLVRLLADGASVGQHVLITADDNSSIPIKMEPKFSVSVHLRVDDTSRGINPRAEMRGLIESIPPKQPGRCIDMERKLSSLIMLPMLDEVPAIGVNEAGHNVYDLRRDYPDQIRATCKELVAAFPGQHVPVISPAPELYPYRDMWTTFAPIVNPNRLPHETIYPLGVSMVTTKLVPIPAQVTTHLIVPGDPKSGRTSILRSVKESVTRQFGPEQAKFFIIDGSWELLDDKQDLVSQGYMRDSMYATSASESDSIIEKVSHIINERTPDAENLTTEAVRSRSWITGPEIFVLIDDYHKVRPTGYVNNNPYEKLAGVLRANTMSGVHIIMSTQAANFPFIMESDKLLKQLSELRVPILMLSGPPAESALWTRGPKFAFRRPGQGTLVDRGTGLMEDIQAAYAPPLVVPGESA